MRNRSALTAMFVLAASLTKGAASLDQHDLAGAGRVAGVEFSEAENQQMLKRLSEHLRALAEMRAQSLPNSVASALVFDPRPPGFKMPAGEPFVWKAPAMEELPDRREQIFFHGVGQIASWLRAGKISSEELTQLSLNRLKQWGPRLNCVVTLTEERALQRAREADAEFKAGKWRGPLHGIPYGLKDLLDVRGMASTWGVTLFTNQIAASDATVVRKLDEAGAILVAKLSLGELAMGDMWFEGQTRNPWKPETGSSGSSAGSASAVSAGLVPFAIGSETLGSIVSPSTVCGVTGLRPTFGRVSRSGAMTLAFSLDKIGPLARSAEDCLLVLQAIGGPDTGDRATVDAPLVSAPDVSKLRVGFLEDDFRKEYANAKNDLAALDVLRGLGISLRPVSLPKHPKGVLYALLSAEAAASFDVLTRSNRDDQLVQQGDQNWPNSFRSARFITAVDYLEANRVRTQLMADMQAIFEEVDVVVAPTWRGNQLLFGNMTGHPCLVVPNGNMEGENPPSICFLAGLFREPDAVALGQAYQRQTTWHRQMPDLTAIPQRTEKSAQSLSNP